MKKQILISFLVALFTVLPNFVQAQGFEIFKKQKVVIWEIEDLNDLQLSDALKALTYQALREAFVGSELYQIHEINIQNVKASAKARAEGYNLKNVCKVIGKQADYIISPSFKLTSNDLRSNNRQLIFNTSFIKVETASEVLSDNIVVGTDQASIKQGIIQLIRKLLGEESSTGGTSSQQPQGNYGYSNGYGQQQTRGTINGHEYVDLGLSVKWATCNVGAYTPENPGKYYAWGETSTKGSYTESNSRTFGVNMGEISGNPNYDVARATWGGTWRLPTSEEFEELIQCCTWTWTTQEGKKGYKVTSRRNGNSIFLPAAGLRRESSLGSAGSVGSYWSSCPTQYNNLSHYIYFNSSEYREAISNRISGFSVRAVSE